MNAKQINELLTAKGGYNGLNSKEKDVVIKFILRATHIKTKEGAIDLLKESLVASDYQRFLKTVERKFNPSQKRIITLALEPIYGSVKEPSMQKGGEIKSSQKGESSKDFLQRWRVMSPSERRKEMEALYHTDREQYNEKSLEINLDKKYKGVITPRQGNCQSRVNYITIKNEDGSFTHY